MATRFEQWLQERRDESEYYPDFLWDNAPEWPWIEVHREHIDSLRWYEVYEVIFKHKMDDEYWALHYCEPSTEMQEFDWDYCIGARFRVKPVEKVVISYEKM